MRQKLVLFVSGIPFFNYRNYIVNKSQTIGCLPTMFLRVRSVTQTYILVGIRRLLLLWHEKFFCRSVCLSLLWKPMWTTAKFGKFTNNATLTMRNMFVGSYYYVPLVKASSLGDPGAVSWGRKNGVESFREREKGPQECYSWRTSFTTYSNNCLWFGAKNNLVP